MVEGFDKAPNYNCNHNFAYYQKFFEDYGFQTYFEQFTFARKVSDPLNPKLQEKADRIFKNPDYSFRHMRLSEIDKYTEYFREIYNKAWASHKGVPQLSSLLAKTMMKQMKPIIDEKIMWFGFYKDEPAAFFIILPEVNQIFKHVNGKMGLAGKTEVFVAQIPQDLPQDVWRGVWHHSGTPGQRCGRRHHRIGAQAGTGKLSAL